MTVVETLVGCRFEILEASDVKEEEEEKKIKKE